MPGKKRKAAAAAAGGTTTKMWGSSSPSSAGNNASSSRRKAPSNRRGGGAKSSAVAVSSSGGSDSKAEKMFEEISHNNEHVTGTGHPKILRMISTAEPLSSVEDSINSLNRTLNTIEPDQLKINIQKIVPEYKPFIE